MTENGQSSPEEFLFGPFRLVPARQRLYEQDKPVKIGSRAREILTALLERPGEVLKNEDLIARAWPETFVEPGNLKVHIAGLRKVLRDGTAGHRYIANIPGRGYSFVSAVSRSGPSLPTVASPVSHPGAIGVRGGRRRVIGRTATIQTLTHHLLQYRFVTVVGPGGIGKTTVALATGEGLAGTFRDGIHFVDLCPIADPLLVPTTVAAALGLPVRSEGTVEGLLPFLREKQALIILDNCEHVIEAAAVLAEEIVREAPEVLILATSREPLGAMGEHVHRLESLDAPAAGAGLSAAEALRYPAVQLFVERAAASVDGFVLKDSDAGIVADACRRLDGLALAIELTASRMDAFGVHGLTALLDDRFGLLRGRRTALPRHQTLGATLDWSYVLLSEAERVVLRRLGIFAGPFTMTDAAATLMEPGISSSEVAYCVANLVAKSFVSATVNESAPRYRLLDTTRAYARLHLARSGEAAETARRHASHFLDRLKAAESDWQTIPAAAWIEQHRVVIDDARAALDWAFSPAGDPHVGIALTIGCLPLFFQLALVRECNQRVERALGRATAIGDIGAQMRLSAALAWSLMQTRGSVLETREAWMATLQHAETLDDLDFQRRALWGLWAGALNRSELRPALVLANRFHDLARRQTDEADLFVADRMIGYILHLLGDQAAARHHIERMLGGYVTPVVGAEIIRFVFDQRVTARCFLARIAWLQGFPDEALRLVEDILAEAVKSGDMLSLCQALVQAACPVSIFLKDWPKLASYVEILVLQSQRNSFGFFTTWGKCFKGTLTVRQGDIRQGLTLLRDALSDLKGIDYGVYYITFLGEFAEALGECGEPSRGLIAIDEALERAEANHEYWYAAELMRIKGVILLKEDLEAARARAEAIFVRSIENARQHAMPSWHLRSVLSLGQLWIETGRAQDAVDLIRSTLSLFTEGFDTHDLLLASRMLETAPSS